MSAAAAPRILVTRTLPPGPAAALRARAQLAGYIVDQWQSDEVMPRAELLARVRGAAGLLCLLTDRIDGELVRSAGSSLRVVSTMSVGYDHVDVAVCRAARVAVGNTPGVLTAATADLTLALLLAAARRLPEGAAAVKSGAWGAWKPLWLLGKDLAGAVCGIVGPGRIGCAVAKRLAAFDMQLVYSARRDAPAMAALGARRLPLNELLAASDFVTLHCAYNADTHHLIRAETLALMRPGAVLVNTTRGAVVDQDALVSALQTGALGAAALDVTTPEPLPPSHPLLGLSNCLVVPHVGSATPQTRAAMADIAVRNVLAGVAGEPLPHAVL